MIDHHTQARLYALRGYARRADRLDGRSPNLWACFQTAGRLIGVGDFRPTYGRFQVVSFK